MSLRRRRGRGLDFEQRFRTSRWAEDLLIQEFGRHGFLAVRLGLSETSEDNLVRETDARFKVPDLLVFDPGKLDESGKQALRQTDFTHLTPDDLRPDTRLGRILCKALCAIEVEFSPYRATEMRERQWQRKTPTELARRPRRRAEPPSAPNIWVKHEDLTPLLGWQRMMGVPILVAHVFDQEAFAIPLRQVEEFRTAYHQAPENAIPLQLISGIFSKTQAYDRVDAQGAGERKEVFVISPAAATRVGTIANVVVTTQLGTSASKKYVAHVLFSGGQLDFDEAFLRLVREIGSRSR